MATGIKAPVPMEELESHLREDIEQQIQSGTNAQTAFETTVLRLGQGDVLKTEFAKAKDFWGLMGEGRATKTNRILAALWMAQCLWVLPELVATFGQYLALPMQVWFNDGGLSLIIGLIVYLSGVFGSIYLFRGANVGRRMIRFLALLTVLAAVAQIITFRWLSISGGALTIFSLVSIWLLHQPQRTKPAV